jgi:hypothetical protein
MPCKVNNRHFIFALKTDSADIGNWLIFQRYKYRCYLLYTTNLNLENLLGNVDKYLCINNRSDVVANKPQANKCAAPTERLGGVSLLQSYRTYGSKKKS